MLVTVMASADPRKIPAVVAQETDDLSDFHAGKLSAIARTPVSFHCDGHHDSVEPAANAGCMHSLSSQIRSARPSALDSARAPTYRMAMMQRASN
jgi:hypothetical protein